MPIPRVAFVLVCLSLAGACAGPVDGKPADLDAGVPSVRALYRLASEPMEFLSTPWPDDGYLDSAGNVRVRAIPSAANDDFAAVLADSMAELDGFGIRPTIYFRFDGPLDPSSLPKGPDATLAAGASVFLIDVDTGSPEAFKRIAVDLDYRVETSELRLRPSFLRALTPGRRYAAIVTRSVLAADGMSIDGAEEFIAIREPEFVLDDPAARAARARYAPVLETLDSQGLPRERVAAMAVFRVQSDQQDLADARALLREQPALPPTFGAVLPDDVLDALLGTPDVESLGLDDGARHEHIGFMVHGTFASVDLLSAKASAHGAFKRDASGELVVRRQYAVPFTLWTPLGVAFDARLPLVIVMHGWSGERSDALPLANALTAVGYAVIAFDAPFHGSRSDAGDVTNRFINDESSDGFGDAPGDFAGISDDAGERTALHPFYYRDAMRQGAVDLMALVHLLEGADFAGLGDIEPMLAGMAFDAHVGFVGLDVGAEMGVMAAANEPALAALVLAFAGGLNVDGWIDSPGQRQLIDALFARLGHASDAIDYASEQPLLWPDVDAWRTLSDFGGALAHASLLRPMPANVFMLMARDDEVVHNQSTEALALALGATLVGAQPRYVPDLDVTIVRAGRSVSGNFAVEEGDVTRVLYALESATHETLTKTHGARWFETPLSAPLKTRAEPALVDNPIAQALGQIVFFFESLRACHAAVPPEMQPSAVHCAGAVQAPSE